ncbi:phospholipid phosphatase-related protein type 1-like [Paramacrobiotus metropolitanus]|uniref:phospholipid phosphatase-related protein type 1-like n=1 Tax=Paramacrobiotus metropolitanus TaxID=2943436 RepID=UPI002445EA7B|nr:phospholipid phosphatase-related protein type 1-like [Paramacrobiotus metropolitanus]
MHSHNRNTGGHLHSAYIADDMHHMLNKADLGTYGDYSDSSDYNPKHPRIYKVNHFVLPLFCLEAIALGCVGALAYYLRFTEVFPLQESIVSCTDHGINHPFLNATALLTDVPVEVFYSVALLSPLVTIFIGELGYWLFSSKPKKVVRAHCIGFKLHLMPRRFFRYAGLFLLGLFTTSIFTDLVKLLIGRPRPYYLRVCHATCINPDGTTHINNNEHCILEDMRFAQISFPSFHASVAAYSALFLSVYLHSILTARGARLLRPILLFSIIAGAAFVGISRYLMNKNHWQDIVTGYILGAITALYLGIFASNSFAERSAVAEPLLPNRRKSGSSSPTLALQDSKSPFFSWFPIPRVSFKTKPTRFVNGFPNHAADYSHDPAAAVTVYHPDLNRSIDNFSRTSNPHMMQHY